MFWLLLSDTLRQAQLSRDAGIHLISIGIGDLEWLNSNELRAMASYPWTQNMLHAESFSAISMLASVLQNAICDRKSYLLRY